MKKYIVSVLIPCLLLQFVGCYSYRQISLVENSELVEIETHKLLRQIFIFYLIFRKQT